MTELEIIRTVTDDDFEIVGEYRSMEECSEIVRLGGFGSYTGKDQPAPMLNKSTGWVWFSTRKDGMIPFYRANVRGDKVALYHMTYTAYNKFGF